MSKVVDAVVVGAGVSGLSTAIRLQEAGWSVQILTADMPQDTVSNVAAASWYPYKVHPRDRLLGWSRRSYEIFEELARDQNAGVYVREGVELLREPAPDPWWKDAVADFRWCTGDELPPGYRDGYAFAQPVIEMPVYLGYLLDRFIAAGGRVEQCVLRSMEEATRIAQTVVNCTGLGARELVGDDQMTPIRGQIVRVSNPGLERCVADEGHPEGPAYIIPRTQDCVLGGTAEEGCWDTTPDPQMAEGILRRCTALEPRLSEASVLEHKVGLRPGRPAIRLEREDFADGSVCVHNYGHGGAGVTLSWGCAEEAVALVGRAR